MAGELGETRRVIRVVLVDDHPMVLEGLTGRLGAEPAIEVVGSAVTALDGIALVASERPDVVVVDYHLPDIDGVEVAHRVQTMSPDTRIVMLTGEGSAASYYAARRAGVAAWLQKSLRTDALVEVVLRVHAGETYFDHPFGELPALDELVAYYQPVVALDGGVIVGFEALVRWNHPARGILGPDLFLPLAEESGFINDIATWMLGHATAQLAAWQQQYPREPRLWMSINLSPTNLRAPGTYAAVTSAITATHVEPGDVVLEITETVLLEDTEESLSNLEALKALGVSLALDDFGTAHSQLSYLRAFPFDHIKLDLSFTADLPGGERSRLLAEHVEQLSHDLHMKSIAEGIERPEQARCLRDVGWRLGQGFLYSEPVDAAGCGALLARQQTEGLPAEHRSKTGSCYSS